MANTKVVTGKVRFSYCSIFEPREPQGGGDPKYSVTLLIPKSDTATLNKIKQAIADAREAFCSRNGANALPARPNHTLHDGDGMRDSGSMVVVPSSLGDSFGIYIANVSGASTTFEQVGSRPATGDADPALADEAAGAEADDRLDDLEPRPLRVVPRVEEAEDAGAAVRLHPDGGESEGDGDPAPGYEGPHRRAGHEQDGAHHHDADAAERDVAASA